MNRERAEMRITRAVILSFAALTGCSVAVPTGPSVAVMPAQGKPFEVFQNDNAVCMQYARAQVGDDPQHAGQTELAASAATGAVIGAAAGAALGDSSHAAGAGAGAGLLMGTAIVRTMPIARAANSSGAMTLPTSNACTPKGISCPARPCRITEANAPTVIAPCRRHRHRTDFYTFSF